jgi:hypothetical protein
MLLHEYVKHPLPRLVIHLGPENQDELDALAFASAIVAHRAERLVQSVELGAAALDNLEHGSVQLAAVAARTLFEIAATSFYVHSMLESVWEHANGSPEVVRQVVTNPQGKLWQSLWKARVGTRVETTAGTASGWPKAVHINDRLSYLKKGSEDFAKTVDGTYGLLCEAVHPNVEAQGTLWRRAPVGRDGRARVCFGPSASESPVKLAVIDAVQIASKIHIAFCRGPMVGCCRGRVPVPVSP